MNPFHALLWSLAVVRVDSPSAEDLTATEESSWVGALMIMTDV